mgnify:CR=1 FL=1
MISASNGVTITSVQGRETLDSRGNPTVEAEVVSIPFTESFNANTREASKATD